MAKAKPQLVSPPKPTKATKIQLRLRPAEKTLLTRAAQMRRTTLSNFLLEHGFQAAQQILADQVHFTLSSEQWKAFCKALDATPRKIPALTKLLTEESAFDGQGSPAG